MSDRLIRQSGYLYGVRFGAETQYCLIDIDAGSPYHPNCDPFAIGRIAAALEPLGLVAYSVCTSSYSGGLHLYFPFSKAQSSWQFAIAVATLLENSGFKIVPGQLETFPNPKPYIAEGTPSLFNAHRLPLQIGSYLLNDELQPIWSTQETFVQQWHFAQRRNDLDTKTLKQILKQAKRRLFQVSGKAEKFINDLNAEIELGWTGYGQTNRLLGRITMRAYIFHHVLSGGQPLAGKALIEEVIETAKSLPGYQEFCRHQHEIDHRAEEWANCIQSSHYFHYGDQKGKFKAKSEDLESANTTWREACDQAPSWNQQQSESARDRIKNAIADLLEKGILPSQATQRFNVLLQYKIGGGSLYRHRDLWHPQFLMNDSLDYLEELNSKNSPQNSTSLLPGNGGNIATSNHPGDSTAQNSTSTGGNMLDSCPVAVDSQDESISQSLIHAQAQREACETAIQIAAECQPHNHPSQKQIERMQQFLSSDDPILIAEATAWAHNHPGVLELKRVRSSIAAPETELIYDWSNILAAISVQVQRLNWTQQTVSEQLQQRFNKPQQSLLTNSELMDWLEWLEQQNL